MTGDLLILSGSSAGQLGGEFAQQVGCGPGPGMRQWAGIVGRRGGSRGSMGGRPAVSDLPSVESAPHRGPPRETGGGRRGRGGDTGRPSDAVGRGGGGGKAVGCGTVFLAVLQQ